MNPYLAAIPQWLLVQLVPSATKPGRTDKIPMAPAGYPIDAHTPANWLPCDQALAHAQQRGAGWTVGFVITEHDDLFCVDIDQALLPSGQWSPMALEIIKMMPGCMVEISQSGTGLHIWGRFANPPPHRMKRADLHLELYTEKRFIAIGTQQTGDIAPHCPGLPVLIERLFKPAEVNADLPDDGPRADWRGPSDDAELLRRALQSRSAGAAFGTKASFADLYTSNLEVLARCYPGDSDDGTDRSSVDAALFQHLAFWTGCDQARMLRLAQQSKLVRDKWEREDYLQRTIGNACRNQRDVLQDKPLEPMLAPLHTPALVLDAAGAPAAPAQAAQAASDAIQTPEGLSTLRAVTGDTFAAPADQARLFNGCIYVVDQHRVLVPGGRMLKPEQFKALYGGYTFGMDLSNEKTTRNAFEALTESRATRAPKADTTFFDPRMPYGQIVEENGLRKANVWWPPAVVRTPGDPSPLLGHIRKLYPDEREYQVVLYTMACLVQYQGYKAQWAPVLQGCEGNGKTFLASVLQQAIGERYTYWPRADKITKDFNGWLENNLLYVVEELMVGDRQDLIDHLKPLITSETGLEIERKGIDQRSARICGNFWFNTNHKNALKKTRNDRRFCVLFSAQQNQEQLRATGITPDYMHQLYRWAKTGGFAVCAHYLATVAIPREFDFTQDAQRAPETRSTAEAVEASRNPTEQEVLEAIEREEVGFRGGWVSSGALERLLDRTGKTRYCPHNQRRALLQGLGYDWHPALTNGRVNNPVPPDAAKVKLFVHEDSPALALRTPSEVAAAYARAQGSA